jgi:bifunctional non-homologous end joining protein LigD
MSLEEYRRKRNFRLTREPKGKVGKRGKEPIFVIQKHAASRLHYDFRLEMGGTLKSWAVPKGLPYEKGEKHLAVQVEDHPLEYGGFEGVIPEGQYGGGTVMLWDTGTYEPGGPDELKALHDGRLHFALHGKKAKGEWALVRMHGQDNQWLLIKSGESVKPISKKRDDQSAVSGRTMKSIAKAHDAEWESNRVEHGKPTLKEKIRAKAKASAKKTPADKAPRKKKPQA